MLALRTILHGPGEIVMGGGAPDAPVSATARAAVDAERRHITVLFCDLVGSTELSTQLDPEDLHSVMHSFQETCASVVRRYDGRVARYMGDAVMVFFGFPQAHEDDAHRAARTGLGIVEAIEQLNSRLESEMGLTLAVRVGINSGLVVVGDMGTEEAREMDVVGETPNLAARLQAVAEPDTVLISEATRRLIEGYFDMQEVGLRDLKGLPEPVAVHQVLHESAARSRLDVAVATGLTPLVGREAEMSLLLAAWEEVTGGRGRAVLLSGEPGIGKSRLLWNLAERVAEDPSAWLTPCQCSPYRQNTAFYPIIDLLERVVLQFTPNEDAESKLTKLEGWLVTYGYRPADMMPLFAPLLSLPTGDRYPPLMLTPERQRQLVIETLVEALLTRAKQQPLLFALEDLHWADPSTMDLLALLIERAPETQMVVLLTSRPEFRPLWSGGAMTEVSISRLGRDSVARMAQDVAGGKELPAEVREQIVSQSDGVPLFVEELTKTVLDSGLLRETDDRYELIGPLPSAAIPVTLQASLLARLDRLPTAREIAQLGAALGRDFPSDLILALFRTFGTHDDGAVERGLRELIDAEILFERRLAGSTTYVFKHALIRDAAYQSLLKSRRREYHEQIARVLEEQFPETSAAQPEVLAHHCHQAGLHEQAIAHWHGAAQQAVKGSANVEAIAYLTNAIQLLERLPDGIDRVRAELDLLVTLGVPLIATRGYAAAEVEKTYARARELSFQVGDTPQIPNIVWGLWVFYLTGGPLPAAIEMAEQYCALAEAHPDDSGLQLERYQLTGIALFYMGEFAEALPHLERGSRLYDPDRHHALIFEHGGADTGVALMTHEALALWALGYPDRGRAAMEAAVACAKKLAHPFSLAFAHYYCAWFQMLCRDEQSALDSATAAIYICDEFGFPFWARSAEVLNGIALVEQGDVDEGLAQMQESLAAFEATGGLLCRCAFRGLLADAYRKAGRTREGLEAVDEALAGIDGREERWWEPELHRLRGELLLADPDGDTGEAEASLQRSLEVAGRQQARSWQLRTAISLARLWGEQGDAEAARELLARIEAELTEGLATADRREARELLASFG
jgi:class 3 adenylate cyclase/predicted ATPase